MDPSSPSLHASVARCFLEQSKTCVLSCRHHFFWNLGVRMETVPAVEQLQQLPVQVLCIEVPGDITSPPPHLCSDRRVL